MSGRMFTEDEVIAGITAVVKAERGRAKFDRRKVLTKAEQLADGNARLLAYARTGDVTCLDGPETGGEQDACRWCGSADIADVPDGAIPTFTCQKCGATWS